MRLAGKVILVTGAGGGMGRVAAETFAREGARVVANDALEGALAETVALVRDVGGEIIGVPGNVAVGADVRRVVEEGVRAFGALHVLYNNAGIMPSADTSVEETDEETLARVLDVNLKGVFLCCKYGIPELLKVGGGSIINIASFVAIVGCTVPQDAYTASKGGVIALTRSLAVQYGPRGIRANALCPGPVETPMLRQLWTSEEERNKRLRRIPLGRFGAAEDIVNAGIFLASDESSFITGNTFMVDGGITVNYF
ncbi:MAG TPA: glucose 1-dehydrogenase [Ktedonobacterales bacterium]|jgi:NAD(P)-dependent dehydrogenase (short-subunit alcohol dehydrogenase family)